jgi:hypothetical protein
VPPSAVGNDTSGDGNALPHGHDARHDGAEERDRGRRDAITRAPVYGTMIWATGDELTASTTWRTIQITAFSMTMGTRTSNGLIGLIGSPAERRDRWDVRARSGV